MEYIDSFMKLGGRDQTMVNCETCIYDGKDMNRCDHCIHCGILEDLYVGEIDNG